MINHIKRNFSNFDDIYKIGLNLLSNNEIDKAFNQFNNWRSTLLNNNMYYSENGITVNKKIVYCAEKLNNYKLIDELLNENINISTKIDQNVILHYDIYKELIEFYLKTNLINAIKFSKVLIENKRDIPNILNLEINYQLAAGFFWDNNFKDSELVLKLIENKVNNKFLKMKIYNLKALNFWFHKIPINNEELEDNPNYEEINNNFNETEKYFHKSLGYESIGDVNQEEFIIFLNNNKELVENKFFIKHLLNLNQFYFEIGNFSNINIILKIVNENIKFNNLNNSIVSRYLNQISLLLMNNKEQYTYDYLVKACDINKGKLKYELLESLNLLYKMKNYNKDIYGWEEIQDQINILREKMPYWYSKLYFIINENEA